MIDWATKAVRTIMEEIEQQQIAWSYSSIDDRAEWMVQIIRKAAAGRLKRGEVATLTAERDRLALENAKLREKEEKWHQWLADIAADFRGVVDDENTLHDWPWIADNRPWPDEPTTTEQPAEQGGE